MKLLHRKTMRVKLKNTIIVMSKWSNRDKVFLTILGVTKCYEAQKDEREMIGQHG